MSKEVTTRLYSLLIFDGRQDTTSVLESIDKAYLGCSQEFMQYGEPDMFFIEALNSPHVYSETFSKILKVLDLIGTEVSESHHKIILRVIGRGVMSQAQRVSFISAAMRYDIEFVFMD
jgi:hypothetical protein